ncbi:alcohol dehydrogenase zinc-binding domain-containing protein [Rhodococcus opacus M213]|uniref:Alcohol dehydrogenase zinc-binding domain-containing protein n=1 Tax=Rhodococcus opacus M213 TaxID=1129896 RepID=K8XNP0_RHOOP|nr:NADP-dependent oxidoreductase [Rhodococcus opacus]EKT83268.1 alcohol dehydrogenase zinc-binding domain-containing protein [Rhodococcus opacus M213]
MKNQSWIVDRASTGTYDLRCFRLIEGPIPSAPDGKIVVQTLLMSLDPTNLNWLKLDPQLQAIPFGIGYPMIGVSIGVVIESRAPAHAVGDVVTGMWGWRRFDVVDPLFVRPAKPATEMSFEQQLAIFSHVGRAAAGGMTLIGEVKPTDAVLVSGATGSLAAQIAKAQGCRVVGIAGGPDKCEFLLDELKLDGAIDYKQENIREAVHRHFPGGVDLFFDNVGGEGIDAVLTNMAVGCRIVLCGAMSQYDISENSNLYGVQNLRLLIFRSARLQVL